MSNKISIYNLIFELLYNIKKDSFITFINIKI